MGVIVKVESASKTYKTGDTIITAINPTTYEFRKKGFTLIIGPSTTGKAVTVVTNNQRLKQYADRVIYMYNGTVSELQKQASIS